MSSLCSTSSRSAKLRPKRLSRCSAPFRPAKKTLIVLPEKDDTVYRSARNIAGVKTTLVSTLNVYDILNCDTILVLKDAVAKIEEVYA